MVGMLGSFFAGIMSFFSPCILPVLPGLFAYLLSNETKAEVPSGWKAVGKVAPFAAGFSTAFVILGLAAGGIGSTLLQYQRQINIVGGLIITIFGLHMLSLIQVPALFRGGLGTPGRHGGFALGLAFSASWTPCVGPILTSLLILVGTAGSAAIGATMLAAYALGLSIPFIIAAIAWHRLAGRVTRMGRWSGILHKVGGAILAVLGLSIMLGYFEQITTLLT